MKNYRILRIAGSHYYSTVKNWVQENPVFENNSYNEMLKFFFKSSIMYSDGFSRSFKDLGQDAYEIIADFEIVQKQWAKENGIRYDPNTWMIDILMAQVKKIKPDIIYLQSTEWSIPGRFFPESPNDNLIKILKETYPFIKKIFIFSGYPSGADRIKGADIIFSSPPSVVNGYRKQGLDPFLLYHSFDNRILKQLKGVNGKYSFTFSGSTQAPGSRYWALRQLMDETKLQAWLFEPQIKNYADSRIVNLKHLAHNILQLAFGVFNDQYVNVFAESKKIPQKFRNIFMDISVDRLAFKGVRKNGNPDETLKMLYPNRCFSSVMGMDMYNLLHQSKITFNKHTDQARGYVGNMRMFEATGSGTCLLTDSGYNMQDLFEPNKEVVTYSSIDDAIEKVNYLMDHPDEAEQIAKAGQARTLKDHNIMNRCQQIDEVIQQTLEI